MAFRLKLIPTLITIPSIIIMLGLGSWQLERMEWKENLIALLEARTSATPTSALPELVTQKDHEFLPVVLEGRFLHENEMLLQNRTHDKKAGMHVLTPFIRAEGGGAILVDRGWVPFEAAGPEHRMANQLEGPLTIEGIIRFPTGQSDFIPDNNIEKNQWYFIDLDVMGKVASIDFAPFYIMASSDLGAAELPIGGQWKVALPNNHLEYALTWYSLALILMVFYILFHRKKS